MDPSSSSTRIPRRWSSPRAALSGPVTPPSQVKHNLNGAVGTLSSEAVGIGCEAFGEDDLSSSGVMSSVLKPSRRESPSTVSISTRMGVSPNVPKSPVSKTVRCSRGSSAGWRVDFGTTLSPSESYHQEGFWDDASACNCVENTTGIPSSPATLNPFTGGSQQKTVICGQDREIL